jgi:DNA-binding NarL/FixJ family response regulator
MRLPTGSGHDLLRTLRNVDPEARAVLITGCRSEMEAKVQTAMDAGASAVCYKPFDVAKLLSTVEALSQRKAAS